MTRALAHVVLLAACCPLPDPPAREPWRDLPLVDGSGVPQRRLEAAVAPLGNELIIAGGYENSLPEGLAITDTVLAYNPLTDTWRDLPRLPVRWTHGALAARGGRLFLLGGHQDVNATASGRSFVLEAGAMEWRELPPMPGPRGAAAVLMSPPFVFLFGGADGPRVLADVIAFDLANETWIPDALPALPLARSHAAVLERVDGTMIIAGGIAVQGAVGDSYRLAPLASRWEPAEPMPTRRGGCAFGNAFGSLVCAGGEGPGSVLDVVERLDPSRGLVTDGVASGEWIEEAAMLEPRAGAPGAMIAGSLYVVGGSRSLQFEPLDSILVFDPLVGR